MNKKPTNCSEDLRTSAAVVIGTAQGLDLAIAAGLAASGVHTLLADIQSEPAASAAKQLTGRGHHAEAAIFDVGDSAAVRRFFLCLVEQHGRLDSRSSSWSTGETLRVSGDLGDGFGRPGKRVLARARVD